MPKPKASLRERIEESIMPVTECGCWIWMRGLMGGGYGTLGHNGRSILAHRASWQVFRGPVPDGLYVLHLCDTRACVNPDHLFLGTHQDNMDDRDRKGRNKPRPGVLNPKAKLTPVDVAAIRSSPLSCGRLARDYGMNKTTMARIKSGKYWRCVA